VFFGGIASERVFADVIAHGDGWLPIEGFGWTIADIDRLRRRASESGRDPTSVRVVVYSATPDQAAADAYLEAGVDQIVYALPPNDFQHVDPALTAASAINQRLGN